MYKIKVFTALLLSVALLSCSVLRKKQKEKVLTTVDSTATKTQFSSLVDTSSAESFQRISFEFPSGYFSDGNFQDFSSLANMMVDAARKMATEKVQPGSVPGKNSQAPKKAQRPADPAAPGIKASLESWQKSKKGVTETQGSESKINYKKEEKKVNTGTETKRTDWPSIFVAIVAGLLILIAGIFIFRFIKNAGNIRNILP